MIWLGRVFGPREVPAMAWRVIIVLSTAIAVGVFYTGAGDIWAGVSGLVLPAWALLVDWQNGRQR